MTIRSELRAALENPSFSAMRIHMSSGVELLITDRGLVTVGETVVCIEPLTDSHAVLNLFQISHFEVEPLKVLD